MRVFLEACSDQRHAFAAPDGVHAARLGETRSTLARARSGTGARRILRKGALSIPESGRFRASEFPSSAAACTANGTIFMAGSVARTALSPIGALCAEPCPFATYSIGTISARLADNLQTVSVGTAIAAHCNRPLGCHHIRPIIDLHPLNRYIVGFAPSALWFLPAFRTPSTAPQKRMNW